MNRTVRKLVTVVAEAAIEKHLVADFETLGARGWTVTDARGKGSRGVRDATWDVNSNVEIQVLCDAATAEALTAHLVANYYDDYAMIVFTSDVEVVRPEKF